METETKNMARDYAAAIAEEVRTLEEVLTSTWEELTTCEECGESENFCESFYGDCAKAICPECNEVGEAYQIGEPCGYCAAVKVANDLYHETRYEFPECVEMFTTMAEEAGETPDEYAPSVTEYLNAFCLEYVETGERQGGNDWELTGSRVLRTFGGPNCWIKWDGGSSVLVFVAWGSDEYSERVPASAIVEQLTELGGAY